MYRRKHWKIYNLYNSNRNVSYILQVIDSPRFKADSLSKLVNNLSEENYRIKCKFGHDDEKCEICTIEYKYCNFLLNTQVLKMI